MAADNGSRLKVGIVGLGRSGWDIHAKAIQKMGERYQVVAVADAQPDRLEEARQTFACRTYDDFDKLLEDDDMDVVVVASPNLHHVTHSVTALDRGKHVVCEKPLALAVEAADTAIQAAERNGRVLAPFQNRRYEPHLLKVREIINSGVLGRIIQIRMCWHGFGRRWDWQTLKACGGGALNNYGAHMVDQALVLYGEDGPEPELFADLQKALTCGDAEDHVKLVLRAQGKPTIDIELTSASAYAQDHWHVMGTAGGLRGTPNDLQWKYVDWSTMPERSVERVPTPDRSYNSEEIPWQSETWTKPKDYPGEAVMFYRDLYETLRHGKPLYVTPESVRRQIALLDRCREACPV